MKIVLASNNRGKLTELQNMFTPLGVEFIPQGAIFNGEAPEPFQTFVENALSKARFAAENTGLPAIADDAGLCVRAWGGKPGVNTAYFCVDYGLEKSDANNNAALLKALENENDRRAQMVSILVGVLHAADPQPLIAVGRVNVEIARELRGAGGFGFDPLLIVPELGKTFAELPPEFKNTHSHRGRSSAAMLQLVRENWLI